MNPEVQFELPILEFDSSQNLRSWLEVHHITHNQVRLI